MTDRLIFGLVVVATFGFALLVPVLGRILWQLRDLRGIGRALVVMVGVGVAWMIVFLGSLVLNRLLSGGGLSDWIVVPLAIVLAAQPLVFRLWYWSWERNAQAPHVSSDERNHS